MQRFPLKRRKSFHHVQVLSGATEWSLFSKALFPNSLIYFQFLNPLTVLALAQLFLSQRRELSTKCWLLSSAYFYSTPAE